MSCGKKAAAQIALLMAGAAMLCFGVWRGEAATVLSKAIKLCLECVDFCRVRPGGRALFFSWKTLRLLPILESGCHSNRQSCGNLLKCSAVGYV